MARFPNPELVIEDERTALNALLAGSPHAAEVRRRLFRISDAASQCLDQAEAAERRSPLSPPPFWRRAPFLQVVVRKA